jgi:hypothetical protein
MTLKNQFKTIKENWVIGIVLIIFLFLSSFSGTFSTYEGVGKVGFGDSLAMESTSIMRAPNIGYSNDFAPQVEERKITLSTTILNEIERGKFSEAEKQLKAIVKSTESFLLNENSRKYGRGKSTYFTGSYSIKVESGKYDSVISQIKQIGEVISIQQNMNDVTGTYTNTKIELDVEEERLVRYEQMYKKATKIEDQINLNDRIFKQERTIKYLEDKLKNVDKRVEYSTIYVTLNEKQSEYVSVTLVKFSELIEAFMDGFNSLIYLIFVIIPYLIAGLLIWLIVKVIRKSK